jgi:antitoxin (DNA-binding transcriptional repressor) of toxin-antitoxin stability system
LPQLLDRVAAGESFAITRQGADVAVLTGHDKWMKTKTHDVILQARLLGAEREALRGQTLSAPVEFDVEARLAEIERGKGEREPDSVADSR